MKLIFWKKKTRREAATDSLLWQFSPLRKLIGNHPLVWNTRFGEQNNLRKNLSKLWKVNQTSLW
ncbi:MAG: hypothetical protein IT219_07720 [Bacteroidales bacterium]|jgi:hypothetical protein|nr:hypothetical protein [Bacteroidales bacterium]